jgi:cyclopropane-fatty-acyl-phospholipid synthase
MCLNQLKRKEFPMWIYKLLETDLLPEFLIRAGIRNMLRQKKNAETSPDWEAQQRRLMDFIQELKASPVAIETDAANEQHYEVPSAFFRYALGPHLKYSCGWWDEQTHTLGHAEENMLRLTCQRAELLDGQDILELGCGWGSLSLWMAANYPKSNIVAVSNSRTQKEWIDGQAMQRNLKNLEVITANVIHFETDRQFDRVVSVEMFEHLKNYERFLARVGGWLNPDGKLFVHIFTHPVFAYHYEDKDGTDWLTRHFFTGGTMPSNHLLLYFQQDVSIVNHWVVSGQHYEKTANAWLENMLNHRAEIEPILATTYGAENLRRWWVYWKVFFLACAELWGYRQGQEWFVSHYLFEKNPHASALQTQRNIMTERVL